MLLTASRLVHTEAINVRLQNTAGFCFGFGFWQFFFFSLKGTFFQMQFMTRINKNCHHLQIQIEKN